MIEVINIFGLKLAIIEDWLSNLDKEIIDKKISDTIWSVKQHLAVLNYRLKVVIDYIVNHEDADEDNVNDKNLDAISERIALQAENEDYNAMLKDFIDNSENLINELKKWKNDNSSDIIEFVMDQFFFFSRQFGQMELKIKM